VSEYQYCEFAAIDRPLSRAEMAQLRAVSTRAEITPAGFVHHYEWGDLKADPADWMRRYFDAFVYTANWCSCRLSLRLPLATFSEAELQQFATERNLAIEAGKTHWIINWSLDQSEDHERFAMDDGHGWIRRLAPLREEMAAVLTLMAQGQGQAAERQVKSRHAAWLKTHCPSSASPTARRTLAQLRQRAQAASLVRQQRQAQERAAQDAERRQHDARRNCCG
jgi:hypothetical protein